MDYLHTDEPIAVNRQYSRSEAVPRAAEEAVLHGRRAENFARGGGAAPMGGPTRIQVHGVGGPAGRADDELHRVAPRVRVEPRAVEGEHDWLAGCPRRGFERSRSEDDYDSEDHTTDDNEELEYKHGYKDTVGVNKETHL